MKKEDLDADIDKAEKLSDFWVDSIDKDKYSPFQTYLAAINILDFIISFNKDEQGRENLRQYAKRAIDSHVENFKQ